MSVNLDGLIEKLKKEGIEEGEQAAEQLIRDAETKASAILEKARKEAEAVRDKARKEAVTFQSNSEVAIRQAARDGELLLKTRITELFDRVFKQEVGEALTPEALKEVILSLVAQWGKNPEAVITLADKDKKKLETLLFSGVGKKLEDTVTLRPSKDIAAGFQIGLKGGDVYYDFTDQSIAEVLKHFLNPRLKEILDDENG